MANQRVLWASENYIELDHWLNEHDIKRVFLVCDSSLPYLRISKFFDKMEADGHIALVRFQDFTPNPLYESVEKGVRLFRESACEAIIAVGGGSAMDVAKCVKLYTNMDAEENFLKQEIVENDIPLLAVPTTAGTGSEATRYAVIYDHGEKQSITHESIIPSTVLMDPSALQTLPLYQKKATMLDALCHAVESYWSVNSTPESQKYSELAITKIFECQAGYLQNDVSGNAGMLEAAHIAGQAINITQTTAGHAMCYKLTSIYGIAHGHAAALCVAKLWPYMLKHTQECVDHRGETYLKEMFLKLGHIMGGDTAEQGMVVFQELLSSLQLRPIRAEEKDIALLTASVNPVRLKNNPIRLDEEAIEGLYRQILEETERTK